MSYSEPSISATSSNTSWPDASHKLSIWASDCAHRRAATVLDIETAQSRLGVVFPVELTQQLLIQDGGLLICIDEALFGAEFEALLERFTGAMDDAAIDGIMPLQEWERASHDDRFNSVENIPGLDRLIKIASHSESQLCLDYRAGEHQPVALTHIFLDGPNEEKIICPDVVEFINALIEFKAAFAVPALDAHQAASHHFLSESDAAAALLRR